MVDTGESKHKIIDGKYEILRTLGKGGMGTVYLARNNRLENLWAIKEVKKENQQYLDLLAEPNILKNLKHMGIPKVVDVFSENENMYIVEEYIEGENLENILEKKKLDYKEVCYISLQLCDILSYLHNCKPQIIYRDLKPSNIMMTPKKEVVLIDFGISRTYKPNKKNDTVYAGSQGFAAPEQYNGLQSDERTDIYGLGATMYCMLTGREPETILAPLKNESYKKITDNGLKDIIKKATQIEPKDRYVSIDKMVLDINKVNDMDFKTNYKQKFKKCNIKLIIASLFCIMFFVVGLSIMIIDKVYKSDEKKSNNLQKEITTSKENAKSDNKNIDSQDDVKEENKKNILENENKKKTYKFTPEIMTKKYYDNFIFTMKSIEVDKNVTTVYCRVENNCDKEVTIPQYKNTYLIGDNGEYVEADPADSTDLFSIPCGGKNNNVKIIFRHFNKETKSVTLKTKMNIMDPNYRDTDIKLTANLQ